MYNGRKRTFVAVCAAWCVAASYGIANSEGEPTCEAPDAKRYDGVGVKSIPRPAEPRKERKPAAVFTTRKGPDPALPRDEAGYDTYVGLSNRPFTPARATRLRDTVINEALREVKRHARKLAREEYLESLHSDPARYVEAVGMLNRLRWGSETRPWRFQYDAIDPDLFSRYDSDWDDIRLLQWGPLTLTDRGSIDVDSSLEGLQKLWNTSVDDIQLAPAPPGEAPRSLLVGRTVRFTQSLNVRLSASKIFKTFYQERVDAWSDNILRSARYVRLAVGLDFCTDILKRKYLGTDLECRYYPSGKWVVFANIELLGR